MFVWVFAQHLSLLTRSARMARVIRVVVSCTERKSVPPLPFMRAAKLTRRSFESRIAMWLERVSAAPPTHSAVDLYQGEHWAVARALIERSAAEVWVASAGYGLVSARAQLASYGATFASGQTDSVMLSNAGPALNEERSKWWQALQTHVGTDGVVFFRARHRPHEQVSCRFSSPVRSPLLWPYRWGHC